jgi:AAA+ ATPase superfamily predicted ATPase
MPSMRFIDRVLQLGQLEKLWKSKQAELLVLYGRRRVGKTELIRRFCQGKPHVYFQAAQVADRDNLRHFAVEAAAATNDEFLAKADFTDWGAPLDYLAQGATKKKLIVVLDEFPYLCESNQALPSVIQRFWDQRGKNSKLLLILCGSSVSFMENAVLSERSPLFGRRTAQMELAPFGYRESAEFVPGYPLEDKLRVFGILGGMPMYLAQFDGRASVATNVKRRILDPQSLLHDEPNYLLRIELRDPRTYNSILEAIASGLTKHNEIAQRVDQRAGGLTQYLANLEELRLIERVASATARAPKKRAAGRYFIRDNFLRFWYRFVLPNRSLLEIGEADRVWNERVRPHLDEHLGAVFEDVCREYARSYARERLPVLPEGDVGRHWHKDAEIEVLSRNVDGTHYCGECKWSRRAVGPGVLGDLKKKAATLPAAWRDGIRYLVFARKGFTAELMDQADGKHMILIDLPELYGQAR